MNLLIRLNIKYTIFVLLTTEYMPKRICKLSFLWMTLFVDYVLHSILHNFFWNQGRICLFGLDVSDLKAVHFIIGVLILYLMP